MQLVLLKDVDKLGRKGQVVRVREGFGRNFLLPRNLALAATKGNQKFVADLKARAEKRMAEERKSAAEISKKLEKVKVEIEKSVGENDKLFGSVTSEDIREALEKLKYVFDKKQIQLKEPIKSLGTHTVNIEIYPQIKATLSVEVVPKS